MGAIAYDCKYIRKVIILREKLIRFMYGRYGMDSLGKFTIIAGLIVMLIAGWKNSFILSLVAWFCIIYAYFRMFSRNIYKRSSENQWYLNKTYKLRCFFARQKNMMAQRKTHHIYKCPTCRQKIRVPKGKGRIAIYICLVIFLKIFSLRITNIYISYEIFLTAIAKTDVLGKEWHLAKLCEWPLFLIL